LCGGKDGEEQGCRRLPAIARRCDDTECAASDPAAAAFIAKRRTPSAATDDLTRRAATVGDRTGPDDEQDSRAILERVVKRDEAVGVDHHFFSELFGVERRVECATLFVASCAGNSAVQHAREDRSRLSDLGKSLHHEIRDNVGRVPCLAGGDRRFRAVYSRENFSFRGTDDDARLGPAPINPDDDLTHLLRPSVPAARA